MEFVVIRKMSEGNETVGEMWDETKIFDGKATLAEVMQWADKDAFTRGSKRQITITMPIPEHQNKDKMPRGYGAYKC